MLTTDAKPPESNDPPRSTVLVGFVVALFFVWGLATVLIDTLIPKLKALFALSYAEVMLTQFCFFLGYFVFSIPAGIILNRIGYIRGIVVGLAIMVTGCLLFAPATRAGLFGGFLLALFIMACGITLLQVAANPFIAVLGSAASAHSRLTLAQAFNALGTTVAPVLGAALILTSRTAPRVDIAALDAAALHALRVQEAQSLQLPFLGIAATLTLMSMVFLLLRNSASIPAIARGASGRNFGQLLRKPRLILGATCIFLYVGAEVSIGSLMINYLMEPGTLGLIAARAGRLVSLYWGGAMVGRFIGARVLRHVPAGIVLCACALVATTLVLLSALSSGALAGFAIIAVGLFNSIMFPTIFSLAIEGLGEDSPRASGIVCMAIVGGAIVPLLTGVIADIAGLATALLVPGSCYIGIAIYAALVQLRKL
jgi:MFS transporter, FHS family, L-fucose permease